MCQRLLDSIRVAASWIAPCAHHPLDWGWRYRTSHEQDHCTCSYYLWWQKGRIIEPTDNLQKKLFMMVTRKQLHSCGKRCYCKHKYGECKYGFPLSMHINNKAVFNARSTRWKYHRPWYIDRNVVSYHATLLLLWGAHLNLQRITSTYWS
jgi:hypothetical protein